MRYQDQCISPGNVWYGTTTRVVHLVMCHTVPRAVYFTCQCVIRYHNQNISPGNVAYGTTSSIFHLAMCYTVSQPVYFTWQYVIRYHNQCISPGNMLYGTTVVPYHTLAGEIHCSWYRMAHYQVNYSGCGTVSHIARWNTLVLVPHDILPSAIMSFITVVLRRMKQVIDKNIFYTYFKCNIACKCSKLLFY
jgi:hypothetical protein